MLNRSLSRLKYANKPRDPIRAAGWALVYAGNGEHGGAEWSGVDYKIAACMAGTLAYQATTT